MAEGTLKLLSYSGGREGFEGCAFDGGAEGLAVIPGVFGGAEGHTLFMTFATSDDNITDLRHLTGLVKGLTAIWHAYKRLPFNATLTDAALRHRRENIIKRFGARVFGGED